MLDRCAPQKPAKGTRKRQKALGKRQEAKVVKSVRAACVERDGYCLIASRVPFAVRVLLGACEGPSEWAHAEDKRRCFTRGQAPEVRHTSAGSCMLCHGHHVAYDAHEYDLDTLDAIRGLDGAFAVVRRAA
jgi:hypothetical protein